MFEKISIVIPCHNEEKNLTELHNELKKVIESFIGIYSFEIILIDDGSSDLTYKKIESLAEHNKTIIGISFSRNFGHQIALLAGLEKASGDIVITMDGDLQHPPSVIPDLITKYNEGYDIVNTKRKDDDSISIFKKFTSQLYYKIINYLSDVKIEAFSADFRLMNRESTDAFLSIREHDRFTRGLVSWIGFNQAIVEYQAHSRFAGTSSYTLRRMIKLALNGITSMSSKPLRMSLYFGFLFFITGIIYGAFILYNYFTGVNVEGWTSILITMLVLGGIQLFILSIIGEYVSRIFKETKARPLYLIKKQTK